MNDDGTTPKTIDPDARIKRLRFDISFKNIPVVDEAGWERLRQGAKNATTRRFPELPEWRQKTQE